MAIRILIMGLPGAGKTTLAEAMIAEFNILERSVEWFNADKVREQFNDWDFSEEGRIRQSMRMRELADNSSAHYVICDFVAPIEIMRKNFDADYTVWIHTSEESRFEDTKKLFVAPVKYNFFVPTKDAANWALQIIKHIAVLESTDGFR